MIESSKLYKTKQYYERVQAGEDKKSVALEIFGRKRTNVIESSEEYQAIVGAKADIERQMLKEEMEMAKRRQLKAYNKLLDKGEELMESATTTDEKIKAQANQRANLTTGVISEAASWADENRNQQDFGNVLEGVIIN